jgi:alkanesulfonate monooxygenase SsuD/methylene tetrahydromethanopterin reductase-like flavin-dependent oxidoreductase (luciferase family)
MNISLISVVDHYSSGPLSVGDLYERAIEETVLAEQLGFQAAFFAEHHFHEYGVVPQPAVLLGAIASRTNKILLGPAVAVLPFHDPRTLAEQFAMLDVLSKGRLVLGVGSGYLEHEFRGYNLQTADKLERFNESLFIICELLSGRSVSYRGKFFHLEEVRLNVTPRQRNVPIYIAAVRKEAVIHVGRRGFGLFSLPYGSLNHVDENIDLLGQYAQGRSDSGAPAMSNGLDPYIPMFHTHVAHSDQAAAAAATGPFERYCASRIYAKPYTYKEIVERRLALFGSIDTVTDALVALARTGVKCVNTMHNFGAIPHDIVKNSMTLLADEVLPRVRLQIGV